MRPASRRTCQNGFGNLLTAYDLIPKFGWLKITIVWQIPTVETVKKSGSQPGAGPPPPPHPKAFQTPQGGLYTHRENHWLQLYIHKSNAYTRIIRRLPNPISHAFPLPDSCHFRFLISSTNCFMRLLDGKLIKAQPFTWPDTTSSLT